MNLLKSVQGMLQFSKIILDHLDNQFQTEEKNLATLSEKEDHTENEELEQGRKMLKINNMILKLMHFISQGSTIGHDQFDPQIIHILE